MVLALVDSCLETIVDNIDMYNLAFKTTKDEAMKRKLEFLQRRYSFDILTKLSTRSDSLEEYVDLLVNKYLKVLDTAWLRNCSWEKVTSKIAEIGSNVENFILRIQRSSGICEAWKDTICYLPNLKCFTCCLYCDELILEYLATFCPNIEEIDIRNAIVTYEAVKKLCKNSKGDALCTKLKKLSLSGSEIEHESVKYLVKYLPSLEIIEYPELHYVLYSLHKNDFLSYAKMESYNITKLLLIPSSQFMSVVYSDLIKVCLSVCRHLKHLIYCLVNKQDLVIPFNQPELEQLSIFSFLKNNSDINIDGILKSAGKNLTSLTVRNCALSVSVLAESCPRMKEIDLNKVHFVLDNNSKPVLKFLSTLTFHKCITLENSRGISLLLSSSTKLASLKFRICNISYVIIESLLKCCELCPVKEIFFYNSPLQKENIESLLLNSHSLSFLSIQVHGFTRNDQEEILKFAEILHNKPKIEFTDCYKFI